MASTPVSTVPELQAPSPEAAPGSTEAGEVLTDFERPPDDVLARLSRLPVANISDAMNKHGVLHHQVRPLRAGIRACGPALTCGSVDLTVKIFAMWLAKPGDVFVLAAGGVQDYACFGELSANILTQRGAAGAIIDGAVRDVAGINQTPLPVFARAVTPRNYHYPFGQPYGSINLPVTCGGILINPGDVIVADEDGVVVVPRQVAAEVAAAAEQIQSQEDSRREAIRSSSGPAPIYEQQLRAAGYTIH